MHWLINLILHMLGYVGIAIVLSTLNCDISTWQWWIIMLLVTFIYINSSFK